MKEIKKLIRLISDQGIKKIDLVSENKSGGEKLEALYFGIKNETINSDQDAIDQFYNQNVNKKTYLQIKRRLENKLLNSLFFLNDKPEFFSDFASKYYKVCKIWVQVRILINKGVKEIAIKLAKKGLKYSVKYEFTEYTILFCRELKKHYGVIEPKIKELGKYSKILKSSLVTFRAELSIEDFYSSITFEHISTKESKKVRLRKLCEKAIKKIRSYEGKITSYAFNLAAFQIEGYSALLKGNYVKVIEIGNKAKEFYSNKPYDTNLIYYIFNDDMIMGYLHLNKFRRANELIHESLKIAPIGSFNWFRTMNQLFISNSLQGNITELIRISSEISQNENYRQFNIHYESWLIKEAYVHLLIRIGKIDDVYIEKYPLRNFRLNRFLNEVPLYSKDKRGLNISILIIQLLFLIEQKKHDQVIDRMDALKQYTYRYLRNDETYRSNCFIKMLLKIPEAGFHPIRTQRHAETLHKKLLSTSMNISEQSSEIEVIPYEKLWDMVIELLTKVKG